MESPTSSKKPKKMTLSSQYRLIGKFILHWNVLETKLNEAIKELCKLDELHGLIITTNLNFQTKMQIFTTMVELLSRSKRQSWIDDAKKTITSVNTINQNWRTMVVHNIMTPVDKTTVTFFKVSAKRKLDYQKIQRSRSDFNNICTEILTLGNRIQRICDDLSGVTTSALAKALASTPPIPGGLFGIPAPLPTGVIGFGTLGVPGLLNLPPIDKEEAT